MSHIRQLLLKPLWLKVMSKQHGTFQKEVDILHLKMIHSTNVTIY